MDGHTCGCGDMRGTIEETFRQFVTSNLPGDLLADLDVTIEDGDFKIQVELRREPTEDEIQRLDGILRSAHADFRRRIAQPRYAR